VDCEKITGNPEDVWAVRHRRIRWDITPVKATSRSPIGWKGMDRGGSACRATRTSRGAREIGVADKELVRTPAS